jgi:hypothetical protein
MPKSQDRKGPATILGFELAGLATGRCDFQADILASRLGAKVGIEACLVEDDDPLAEPAA